jgi:hypothetical protein
MCVERGCLSGGDGSMFEHSLTVNSLRCVMNDPRQQRFIAAIEQSFQYEFVQAPPSRHGNRIFYGQARQLVSESDRFAFTSEHTRADAFFERSRVRIDCVSEQPHFSSRRNDRHEFQDCGSHGRKLPRTRHHGITHSNGHPGLFAFERLRDEERVAASDSIEIFEASAGSLCKSVHCGFGKCRKA